MKYYYNELLTKALSENATQSDIDKLGQWFDNYGDAFWNGETYTIDDTRSLKPIYVEIDEAEFQLSHYEIV